MREYPDHTELPNEVFFELYYRESLHALERKISEDDKKKYIDNLNHYMDGINDPEVVIPN